MPRTHRAIVFASIVAACVAVSVVYTFRAARTAASSAAAAEMPSTVPSPFTAPPRRAEAAPLPSEFAADADTAALPAPEAVPSEEAAAAAAAPAATGGRDEELASAYLLALNMRDSPELGRLEYARVQAIDERTTTTLRCERTYFAAGVGICLRRELRILVSTTVATIVDASFRPLFEVRTAGIPSRARISRDGRLAAFTVFVTGHDYADTQLSTATLLVDVGKRATIANLEEFEVWQDGRTVTSPDFNYWGVTFEDDSNVFYATLRTGGVNYLVRGDIAARTVTVLHRGVECPSLSPDGTRVAFKKLIARGQWRAAVLDLTTFEETLLAETGNVDDQIEWLDDERVLYALPDPAPWMTIMVARADGSGQPQIFAKGAASPAVVRAF
jgi:hypothetical protein